MDLQLLHKGHLVVAAARNPKKSSGLESLASKYGSALTLVTLDVSDADSIKVLYSTASLEMRETVQCPN